MHTSSAPKNELVILCNIYAMYTTVSLYQIFFRISTRAVLIPFSKPSISLGTEEDDAIFDQLEGMFRSGDLSKTIGWIIGLGCNVSSCRKGVTVYKAALRGEMSGRKLQNWALLLHFTAQVRIYLKVRLSLI